MNKKFLSGIGLALFYSFCLHAEGITGFWKTLDETTKKPSSIIAVYPYENAYYGRIMITFDEAGKVDNSIYEQNTRAPALAGDPYYAGLDLLWGLKKEGEIYKDGQIIDPEKGKIYKAEAWQEGDHLVVRGEVLIFGRDEIWPAAQDGDFPSGFVKPDLAKLVPVIPKAK